MTSTNTRTALVTGASKGIGAACAHRLAADGLNVVVNYASDQDAAEQVVREISAAGGRAIPIQADVANPDAVARMFDRTKDEFGTLDVLINNAGIMKLAKISDSDDTMIDRQIAVNLKGTINTLRAAAQHLSDGASVINFSTSVVGLNLETYGIYAATKAAIETLTIIYAKEMRGRAITVNAIAPGPTATDLFLDGKPAEVIDRMAKMPPLERLGTPTDIANVVSFLAGPNGAWINGQVLRANGGLI